MDWKRFCWLMGACALVLCLVAVPIGCGPVEPTDDGTPDDDGTSAAETTDDGTPDDGAPDDGAPDDGAPDDGAPAAGTTDDGTSDDDGTPEAGATAAVLVIPVGLPPLEIPEDNPMTAEKVELGKMLYFDKRLSKDGTVSCATCHDPTKGWTDQSPTSTGIDSQVGGANAPTVINAAYAKAQFWDGRAATLEEQALGPIENPIEMGHSLEKLVPQLNEIEGYKQRFQAVFGTDVTSDGIAKAIAAFERTVLSGDSAYDKFKAGDESALTEAQKRGLELFESVGCDSCHKPPLFSNYVYHNAGVGSDAETPHEGRKAVTGEDKDHGKFRVPSLRDVANTFPHFHDGSAATLEEAVALMAGGGKANDNLSSTLEAVGDEGITEEQQKDIVEFLKALTGNPPVVEPPELP